tara:strand:+ start:2091 stop:2330 length:240 start_codon:yes stop_codon:yes gene_type:complete
MPIYTSHLSSSAGASLTGSVGSLGFFEGVGFANSSSIANNMTLSQNYNAVLYGPITINNSVTFTIESNSTVKIKDIEDA